jgi:nucleotide-binding universal stress UspA family protein
MKNILVPIDFSDNAEKALAVAKSIANKTGANLTIMHAFQPYISDASIPLTLSSLPVYDEAEETYRERLDNYVDAATNEGYLAVGMWETGGTHSAILRQAKETNADLIIVGRTGKGGFIDKLIGSSATAIALDAKCPVLVVPPQLKTAEFGNVVYATQLEYEELDILRDVLDLVKQLGARLNFVKINSSEQPDIQSDRQFIEQITSELGIPASDIVIRKSGHVLEGIEAYCDETKADLLVVSTRERGFLERLIINPSLTKKLVTDTHIPLLVYHLK